MNIGEVKQTIQQGINAAQEMQGDTGQILETVRSFAANVEAAKVALRTLGAALGAAYTDLERLPLLTGNLSSSAGIAATAMHTAAEGTQNQEFQTLANTSNNLPDRATKSEKSRGQVMGMLSELAIGLTEDQLDEVLAAGGNLHTVAEDVHGTATWVVDTAESLNSRY